MRTALRGLAVLAILTAVLGTILAQNTAQKSESHASLRAKAIIGSTVHLQGNTAVGTVEDIVFDDEGVIDYFVVSDRGKMVTVPWEAAKFNFEKRTATININMDQFRQIPTYTTERYPDFYAPAYQTEIYKYYGLRQGQERRFDRRMRRK